MAMPQTITAVRHVYADGQFKRMLINGEWVRAASGKTFESRNPATGEAIKIKASKKVAFRASKELKEAI